MRLTGKLGLIKTLVIRIYRICSKEEQREIELNELKKTLQNNGYPPHIIRRGISEAKVIIRKQAKGEMNRKEDNITFFTITYYGQESLIFAAWIKKICEKLLPSRKIQFAFKKHLSLKHIFLPSLKGRDESKANKKLVYSIPCSDCDKVYIGETNRKIETRIAEHQTKIRTLGSDSKIVEHILQKGHQFDLTNVSTLTHESNWRRRVIKEYPHQQSAWKRDKWHKTFAARTLTWYLTTITNQRRSPQNNKNQQPATHNDHYNYHGMIATSSTHFSF